MTSSRSTVTPTSHHQQQLLLLWLDSSHRICARCASSRSVCQNTETKLDSIWDLQPMKVAEKWRHMFWPSCRDTRRAAALSTDWSSRSVSDRDTPAILCCNSRLCWRQVHETAYSLTGCNIIIRSASEMQQLWLRRLWTRCDLMYPVHPGQTPLTSSSWTMA